MTKNQQAYQKELNRIKRSIRYYRKKYDLYGEIGDILPQNNRMRITKKAISELKEITGRRIKNALVRRFSIVDTIKSMIDNIPDNRGFRTYSGFINFDFSMVKAMLTSFVDDGINFYGNEYIEYLNIHQGELLECFEIIHYDSDQQQVNSAVSRVGDILKGGGLSMSESIDITELGEYLA